MGGKAERSLNRINGQMSNVLGAIAGYINFVNYRKVKLYMPQLTYTKYVLWERV